MPDWLAPLLTNVSRIWRGHPAPPAALERRTTAGRFRFKAYRFADAGAMRREFAIVIYIEHFPPLELEIERLGFRLGLTERQRELCTQLVLGRSHSEIARCLALRDSTVVDHVRRSIASSTSTTTTSCAACFVSARWGSRRRHRAILRKRRSYRNPRTPVRKNLQSFRRESRRTACGGRPNPRTKASRM
ncbi:hypothetical protein [Burkholderia ubonensis]|uniref:hypothetical protein n=1 Tax=Burkholderia ubonensis TaxID=101571 RepID=UPI001E6400DA|nr:hypothetical protein [Burkholderia ubonensis]